jgi:hypothetical protein
MSNEAGGFEPHIWEIMQLGIKLLHKTNNKIELRKLQLGCFTLLSSLIMLHSTAWLIRTASTIQPQSPPPTKETKTFWQKNESIHHHLKVMPRICGPSQKGGWTQPHDRNVEFLYTYTASPMFGGDYWEKSIKEPLLFRCNDQQTERSNQQVLPQQRSTIPPLTEHKLSEYSYLNHKS